MKDKSTSVKSPASSISGTIKNSGGMPPTMSTEQIFKENQPPATPAKGSVTSAGSK